LVEVALKFSTYTWIYGDNNIKRISTTEVLLFSKVLTNDEGLFNKEHGNKSNKRIHKLKKPSLASSEGDNRKVFNFFAKRRLVDTTSHSLSNSQQSGR
jgi:hypothetical protein